MEITQSLTLNPVPSRHHERTPLQPRYDYDYGPDKPRDKDFSDASFQPPNEKTQKMSKQTLWLCRHGNRIDFVDPTQKGLVDPHLSEDGIVQAKQTGERLRGEGIRHVFSSPFYRAVETAHYIAEALDLPIKIEHGACEWMNAFWFATQPVYQTPEALRERFPRVDVAYKPLVLPCHPETNPEMLARCAVTAKRLVEAFPEDMVIIGHGASVSGLAEGFLGRKPGLSCCAVCALTKIVRENGEATLELNGDASHLLEGEAHRGRMV